MYKICIIVSIVLIVIFAGMIMWENNEEEQLEKELGESIAHFLSVENKQKPIMIEMAKVEEDEILIFTYEKALELKQKFPIGGYTYFYKDMPWPITQSISIDKFIEWLYENDYEIVKKEGK